MIILKKIPDENNSFDFTTVEIKAEPAHAAELVEMFRNFMSALGYAPKTVKEYLGED